jgi:hypothetical protein
MCRSTRSAYIPQCHHKRPIVRLPAAIRVEGVIVQQVLFAPQSKNVTELVDVEVLVHNLFRDSREGAFMVLHSGRAGNVEHIFELGLDVMPDIKCNQGADAAQKCITRNPYAAVSPRKKREEPIDVPVDIVVSMEPDPIRTVECCPVDWSLLSDGLLCIRCNGLSWRLHITFGCNAVTRVRAVDRCSAEQRDVSKGRYSDTD